MDEYISREAAIDKMRSLKSSFRAKNDWDSGYDTAIAEAFEHIKRVPVADVQPVNQWISVKDRLPEKEQKVLVFYKAIEEKNRIHNDVIATNWRKSNGDFIPFGGYEITHWMPLPNPPRDGDAE